MIDIVIPNNNEEEFIKMAEKLGYKELLFLYNFEEYLEKQQKGNAASSKIRITRGILANERNMQKINNRFMNKGVFVAAKSPFNSREIIERPYANMVFSLEESGRKDFMHQRGSGLDHILAKLAHDNNVAIGVSLNSLLSSKNKHIILGRMMQNIKLCRKYKAKAVIASFAQNPFEMRSPNDIISLFLLMGMTQKDSLNYIFQ